MKRKTINSELSKYVTGNSDLAHVPTLSYGRKKTDNMIIQGDNVDVLNVLRKTSSGQVRCIYIDPPYNNRERYNHYDDQLNHETWLKNIVLRLKHFMELLTDDGSLWISIDDREVHYLKVAADSIFSRDRFVSTIIWEQRTTRENRKAFSNNHEYLLVYAKNPIDFRKARNQLDFTPEAMSRYKNPDNDPRGPWQSVSANVQDGHATSAQFYDLVSPTGRRHLPPKGRCWIYSSEKMQNEISKNNIWFGEDGNAVPRLKVFLRDIKRGLTPHTLWLASEVSTTKSAKKHLLQMFPHESVFDTPKPEHLIHRILRIATEPEDLVLDAYLGSGTTAAVAHKMGRRYIGIEQGDHIITHCAQRLRMVVDGEAGGISKLVNWTGGGGFRFYRLSAHMQNT